MKEAIEAVIKDFEDNAEHNTNDMVVSAFRYAIRELKGVLAQHDNGSGENDSSGISRVVEKEAEQNEKSKNGS